MSRRHSAEGRLTHSRVRTLLSYSRSTGAFTWRVSRGSRAPMGGVAGSRHAGGYRQVRVDGRVVLAHRLAHFYVKGAGPEDEIDHRNGDRSNNRWRNLRPATSGQNGQNCALRKDNRSGLRGVGWHSGRQQWRARIREGGTVHNLGWFNDPAPASVAYLVAKVGLHTFQPVPRD